MKYVLAIIGLVLVLLGGITYWSFPDVGSPVPVVYWQTDDNPARAEQVELFHRWLINHDHSKEHVIKTMDQLRAFRAQNWSTSLKRAIAKANDSGGAIWAEDTSAADLPITVRVPAVELRLNTGGRDTRKVVIQGVSGVASTLIGTNSGGGMRYLHDIGLLEPVTQSAKRMGFSPAATYDAIKPEITADGEQYTFPANVSVPQYWVNKDTFARYDQPMPPTRWSIEEFERRGKAFVEAANQGRRQNVFFANKADLLTLFRSKGLSKFNETLTHCTVDDPRFVASLKRIYKWTKKDHIIPTKAQAASFDTASGYGGASLQLFHRGNYAMVEMGRYALIQLRKFGAMNLAVAEKPNDGFPNAISGTRAVGIYAGAEHKDLARYFLAYLASKPYNQQIVRDADALPPNPRFTRTKLYKRPPRHPNEWAVHEPFAQAMRKIAISRAYSPFVLDNVATRLVNDARDAVMANEATPRQAANKAALLINARMQQNIHDRPKLAKRYKRLKKQQAHIDRLRKAGKKVPLKLIKNPFYRAYYKDQGWLASE